MELVLAQAKNQVLFHLEGVDIVSRLIDGQFPNYQQVLPGEPHDARRDRPRGAPAGRPARRAHRQQSANIVKLAGGRRWRGVDRDRDGRGRRLHRRRRGDRSRAIATTIAFNARYLDDVLGNVGRDRFALELNGPLSPGVFRPVGDATTCTS